MMPNGILAREYWEDAEIGSQDFGGIFAVVSELITVGDGLEGTAPVSFFVQRKDWHRRLSEQGRRARGMRRDVGY
jgi:hypothetical protein